MPPLAITDVFASWPIAVDLSPFAVAAPAAIELLPLATESLPSSTDEAEAEIVSKIAAVIVFNL